MLPECNQGLPRMHCMPIQPVCRKAYGKRTPRNGVVPDPPIVRPSATSIDDSVPEKVTGREASAAYSSSVSKRPVNGLQNGHANGHSIFRHSEQ